MRYFLPLVVILSGCGIEERPLRWLEEHRADRPFEDIQKYCPHACAIRQAPPEIALVTDATEAVYFKGYLAHEGERIAAWCDREPSCDVQVGTPKAGQGAIEGATLEWLVYYVRGQTAVAYDFKVAGP